MTMRRQTQKTAATALLVAALVLGVIGYVLWDQSENDSFADDFGRASALDSGRFIDTDDPNRTPAIATWILAGLGVVSGVVLLGTANLKNE